MWYNLCRTAGSIAIVAAIVLGVLVFRKKKKRLMPGFVAAVVLIFGMVLVSGPAPGESADHVQSPTPSVAQEPDRVVPAVPEESGVPVQDAMVSSPITEVPPEESFASVTEGDSGNPAVEPSSGQSLVLEATPTDGQPDLILSTEVDPLPEQSPPPVPTDMIPSSGNEIGNAATGQTAAETMAPQASTWVVNTRSGVYHKPGCRSAGQIASENYLEVSATVDEMRTQYKGCGNCYTVGNAG